MRFLHTADWHLGRRFGGQSLIEEQGHVLRQFVDLTREFRPDAVLISGDIYDRAVPPPEAVQLLNDVLADLHAQGIVVVLIAGNHDSAERLAFLRDLLRHQHVHVSGWPSARPVPVVLRDDWGEVHVHAVPFAEPALVRARLADPDVHSFEDAMNVCLAPIRRDRDTNARHVLLAHAFVTGANPSRGSERRLALNGDETVGPHHFQDFHYVALGHLHEPQSIPGHEHVRYAGSILKYSFDEERQEKGVLLVDMDAEGHCEVRHVPLTPKRDVRRVQGYFQDFLNFPADSGLTDDYLSITLLDPQYMRDAIHVLRQRFPHILELRYEQVETPAPQQFTRRDAQEHTMLDLFEDFYRDVYAQTLTPEQREVLISVLERDALTQREVSA